MERPTLDYYSAPPQSDLPRKMNIWVFALLTMLWLAGAISGEMVWSQGRSPEPRMFYMRMVGLFAVLALYVVFRNRLSRLSVLAALTAFGLGFLSTCAAFGPVIAARVMHYLR
jgi:hypothetical protein